jgi:hypothetical protein
MGWQGGFAMMEALVIQNYDRNMLTKDLLNILMLPYKNSDCDPAGSQNLRTHNGKNIHEVICEVMSPTEYQAVVTQELPAEKLAEQLAMIWQPIWRQLWGIY